LSGEGVEGNGADLMIPHENSGLVEEMEKEARAGQVSIEPEDLDLGATLDQEEKHHLLTQWNFKWQPQDQENLARITSAVNQILGDSFADAFTVLDQFYSLIKKPVKDHQGNDVRDERGRVVWDSGSDDLWGDLTGQDIEQALLRLARVKLETSTRTAQLLTDAVYAKHIFQDQWYEEYSKALDGTIKDRDARANARTKEAKYLSFFRYCIWVRVEAFQKELSNVVRLLERIRDWRIRELPR